MENKNIAKDLYKHKFYLGNSIYNTNASNYNYIAGI